MITSSRMLKPAICSKTQSTPPRIGPALQRIDSISLFVAFGATR